MAESHLLFNRPCDTYSALLDRNCVASGKYCEALAELVLLAGKQKRADFEDAMRNCEICLTYCERTAAAMLSHKATHRCC